MTTTVKTAFKIHLGEQQGPHVRVSILAGPDIHHLALCGHIIMLKPEAQDLALTLARSDATVVIEQRGPILVSVEDLSANPTTAPSSAGWHRVTT